ncbi:hypothetical protein EMIT0P100_240045 [Pseudomonas sp. IT-P100]
MARSGFEGADHQEYQQQRADQAQADHQRDRYLGVAQDHRADDEHHNPAQPDHAIIGQGRFGDQKGDAQHNQPDPDGVGDQHEGVRRERRSAQGQQQRHCTATRVHLTLLVGASLLAMNLRAPRLSIESAFPLTPIVKYSLVEPLAVRILISCRRCSSGQISRRNAAAGLDFQYRATC